MGASGKFSVRCDCPQELFGAVPHEWHGSGTPEEVKTVVHRILVVEDQPDVRNMLVDLLITFGHRAESATNGSEAIMLLAERSFALILTDLHMPEMDGEALYQKIAQTWPHMASRVVFVTSGEPSRCLDVFSGCTQVPVLRKPFNSDALRQLVEQMLRQEYEADR